MFVYSRPKNFALLAARTAHSHRLFPLNPEQEATNQPWELFPHQATVVVSSLHSKVSNIPLVHRGGLTALKLIYQPFTSRV